MNTKNMNTKNTSNIKRASPTWRWTKRIGLGLAIAVVALAGTGAIYQQVMYRVDARTYAPPGRLVEVEGTQMHLYCTGTGAPTVLLEAGATGFAQTWGWIQPRLATSTRVCSYDRMGMGWSEKTEGPHDGQAIARNLRALLTEAGETGPFVVAGHSLGGPFVRIFAEQYPEDVVAVALLDASHEDQLERFPPEAVKMSNDFRRMLGVSATLTHVGVLRATNLIGRGAMGLPEHDYGTARMFAASPKHLRTSHAELVAWERTMDATRTNRTLGDRPLAVVSASGRGMPPAARRAFHAMHAELALLSSTSQHVILREVDHYSMLMRQTHADQVSEILLSLVNEARRYAAVPGSGQPDRLEGANQEETT